MGERTIITIFKQKLACLITTITQSIDADRLIMLGIGILFVVVAINAN